jgi:hypothetical protein
LFVTDTGSIWVGDGVSPGGVQVTGLTIEDSVDAVAAALVAGVNQNITFIYGTTQDQANRIDARLDLSNVEGTIVADGFKGSILADDSGVIVNTANRNIDANTISANAISSSNITVTGSLISPSIISDLKGSVFGDDSTILINGLDSSINLNQTIKSDIIPAFDSLTNLGSIGSKFASLHLGSEGLYIDGAQIQATFLGAIDLPEGSTVNGQPISVLGNLTGDINANIIGDDSSVIVNVATGNIRGNFIGDLRGDIVGSVFGDDSTIIVDGTGNTLRTTNLTFFENKITSDTGVIEIGNTLDSQRIDQYTEDESWMLLYGTYDPLTEIGPWIEMRVSEGSLDSPTATEDGSVLSGLLIFGHDGTSYQQSVTIAGKVTGTTSTGAVPGELLMFCQSDTPGESSLLSFKGNQGVLSAPTIQPGVYADATARDAFLTAPQAGMMVFNTALQKFQGYVSDTGLAGGGPSNATPGWIDLN